MDTPSKTSILWTIISCSALARNVSLGNKISTMHDISHPLNPSNIYVVIQSIPIVETKFLLCAANLHNKISDML